MREGLMAPRPDEHRGHVALALGAGAAGLGILALLMRRDRRLAEADAAPPPRGTGESVPNSAAGKAHPATVRAAQNLNRAAGLLALSVLLDSGLEHYRAYFHNKAMYTPLVVSSLTLAISTHGLVDRSPRAHGLRHATYAAAALTGFVGTGFHVYNVTKRPGGFSWLNLFYGAPLGAPTAILLSGLLGTAAERVRNSEAGRTPHIFGLPAGRTLAAITAVGLLGTSGEAGLLHFRGNFQNPFMYLPVTLPPAAAAVIAGATALPSPTTRRWARRWLGATAIMGFAGVGFHIYGVSRAMGGWRNWRQNMIDGPPIPAPPSFSGLAVAGMAALRLLERKG